MTRRIRLAIVLTAWTILAIGGVAGYVVMRQVLLNELDDGIVARASALPRFLGVEAAPGEIPLPPGDKYVIKNAEGQTLGWFGRDRERVRQPEVLGAEFVRLGGGERARQITLRATQDDSPITIIYRGSAANFDRALTQLMVVLLITGLLCAVASAWVARWVTAAVLQPLNETGEVIGAIDEKNLARRIAVEALPGELRPMGQHLNGMLERLDKGFARQKQFLADAAHELRTPVAALMTSLEVTLMRPRDAAALKQTLAECLGDVKFLRRLVERLLEHARSGGQAAGDAVETVDVSALLEECARTGEVLGASDGVRIERHFEAGMRARLAGNRFRSVVMNLVGNGVEYNRTGGIVQIECIRREKQLLLRVRDDGPGIAAEHLPHIFEAFYRGDRSRQREGEHAGLGLYLVRSHVEAMGGVVDVESEPGRGTTFSVSLPVEWEAVRPMPPADHDEAVDRIARERT